MRVIDFILIIVKNGHHGGAVVSSLSLHSEKDVGLNLRANWDLSVWSLYVLLVTVWVSSGVVLPNPSYASYAFWREAACESHILFLTVPSFEVEKEPGKIDNCLENFGEVSPF